MQISWFTVIAQIVNFLILVWLLKRFLYKPVLKTIDDREKKIADRIGKAEDIEKIAVEEKTRFEEKNNEIEQKTSELLEKAKIDANKEREEIINKVKTDAMELKKNLQEEIKAEKAALEKKIVSSIRTETFEITRKMLTELADASLEKQIISVFLERLDNLQDPEKNKLKEAIIAARDELVVQTAFDLSPEQKKLLEEKLKLGFENKQNLNYQVVPELIGGIELVANDYKLGWSMEEYLGKFVKKLEEMMEGEMTVVSVKTGG